MNYIKLQTELLKMLDNNIKKHWVHACILKDGNIGVLLDSYAIYVIPKDKFYFDFNKIPGDQFKADSLFSVNSEAAVKTNELMKVNGNTLVKLKSENAHTWVDEKLLRFFDKECTFNISADKPKTGPIIIFEDKTCVGVVLPYKVDD